MFNNTRIKIELSLAFKAEISRLIEDLSLEKLYDVKTLIQHYKIFKCIPTKKHTGYLTGETNSPVYKNKIIDVSFEQVNLSKKKE